MKAAGLLLSVFLTSTMAFAEVLTQPRPAEELQYVKEQNDRSRNYLYENQEVVNKVKARATELLPQNAPVKINFYGAEYMFAKGSLVKVAEGGGPGEVIVDIATLPAGAGAIDFRISPDQTKIVFGYSVYGTDWQTWAIMDLNSKEMIDEPFYFKNTGLAEMSWMPDSSAVLYERSLGLLADLEAKRKPGVMLHRLGTSQAEDTELFGGFETEDSSRWTAKAFTDDSVIVYRDQGAAEIPLSGFLVKLSKGQQVSPQALVPTNRYFGRYIGNKEGLVFFRTSQAGSKYGIVAVDPVARLTKVIVPAERREVLAQAMVVGDKILTQYMAEDLKIIFRVYALDGSLLKTYRPSDFGLEDVGSPSLPLTNSDATSTTAYFTFSSVEKAPVTFRFDVSTGEVSALPSRDVPFDGGKIKRELVYYPSHDGKSIPMFLFSRTDRQGPAEYVYLYNYGFIGISNLPSFNRKFQLALDMGAIVAVPLVRGGGEFGLNWQLAGTKDRWNTLKDVVYASRWVKGNLYVKDGRVVLSGRSFGGTSTMSEFVHFQDEFDVFTPVCSISDLSKFIREESGWWAGDDFGIRRDEEGRVSPDDYLTVYYTVDTWSALLHLDKVTKAKPMMAFSQEHDTRVGPQQTSTFIKALQGKLGADAPIYMIELERGGHNTRAELTDEVLFIMKQFGITDFQPVK